MYKIKLRRLPQYFFFWYEYKSHILRMTFILHHSEATRRLAKNCRYGSPTKYKQFFNYSEWYVKYGVKWLYSTNHKNIRIIYLIIGIWSSIRIIRIELINTKNNFNLTHYLPNNYNSCITKNFLYNNTSW